MKMEDYFHAYMSCGLGELNPTKHFRMLFLGRAEGTGGLATLLEATF